MRIATGVGLILFLLMRLSIAQPVHGAEQTAESDQGPNTIAVLPLAILTDDPAATELAESAYEKTLSVLVSVDGIRVLGPETTWPFVNYEMARESVRVILEEYSADAVLRTVVREQGPTITFELSLFWPEQMRSYLALLAFDPQITMQGRDGQPMTVDTMLEAELSKLVNTIQAL